MRTRRGGVDVCRLGLVAARVTEPAGPANVTTAAARAMRFYADPSEQNAAATLGAGSSLDVLA